MIQRLEEFLRKDPFVPFRIVTTSGHDYDVISPFMVATGKSELTYYYPKSDHLAHVRLNQITAFETLESQN